MNLNNMNIKINFHSSICINDNVYVDPYMIQNNLNNAKVVFITHSHYDHLDIASIRKVLNRETKIVCTQSSAEMLKDFENDIIVVKPNESGKVLDISYHTFPSYNFGHHHFKDLGFVGYTLEIDGVKYTICGDTDATPELENVKTDVLFVPIGGKYTMDAQEACRVTNIIKPKLVVPTHYNSLADIASKDAEKVFANGLDEDIKVRFLVP